MKTPLLSVCLITYNHEKFIRQAIDGVLMQIVDFDWELFIADDCSSDKTREIILEYKEKHPDFIHLIFQENNVGPAKNWMDLISAPKSKYIAYFEGDDYWTDPLKLQKQVDFLENNQDYSLCCGGYISRNVITNENKEIIIDKYDINDPNGFSFTLNEMSKEWITKSLTSVFKKDSFDFLILNKYDHVRDIHLFYHLIQFNKGYYFNTVFGVYNIHSGGVNSMQQGKVNFNASYNSYKELYFFNKDEFTRKMCLKATLSLLSFDIYNSYSKNTFNRRAQLFKEAFLLVRNSVEIKWLVSSFISKDIKNIVKYRN